MENKPITKEDFLSNTTETELFCLLHEFKMRFNEMRKEDTEFFLNTTELFISDKDLNKIADKMIMSINGEVWL